MTSLYDASREDIAGLLSGQPAFRLKQVWEGLYTQFAEPSQILTLPGAVREELTKGFPNSLNLTPASVSDNPSVNRSRAGRIVASSRAGP